MSEHNKPVRPEERLNAMIVKNIESGLKIRALKHRRSAVRAADGAQSYIALAFSAEHIENASIAVLALAEHVWGIKPKVTSEPK